MSPYVRPRPRCPIQATGKKDQSKAFNSDKVFSSILTDFLASTSTMLTLQFTLLRNKFRKQQQNLKCARASAMFFSRIDLLLMTALMQGNIWVKP